MTDHLPDRRPALVVLNRLMRLAEISVSELAAAVDLAQATVTGIVDRLAQRGLAERRRDEHDIRRVLVRVARAGDEFLAGAPPLLHEHFLERFTGCMPGNITSSCRRCSGWWR